VQRRRVKHGVYMPDGAPNDRAVRHRTDDVRELRGNPVETDDLVIRSLQGAHERFAQVT
jgi:hypothetical protein